MKSLLNKLFKLKSNKFLYGHRFTELTSHKHIKKLFEIFSAYNDKSEIRFVGGCIRKILMNEKIDDIDLATNINPSEVKKILKDQNIKFIETGLSHGTITVVLGEKNYEITSLRKDVSTDGRHANVKFTNDWKEDASRRDFSINSIYSDIDGNLFDPYNGKFDLKNGKINFIGNPNERIKEDYLRILRYIRFFLNYSNIPHDEKIKKVIRQNINGVKNLSKERLIDELRKIFISKKFSNLAKDPFIVELIRLIFPELHKIEIFKNLNDQAIKLLPDKDFIFLISVALIDNSDNSEYFLFKYNISNREKRRIKFIKSYYNKIFEKNFFTEKNLNRIYYYNGISYIEDLIDFKIFNSKKINKNLIELKQLYIKMPKPVFPIKAGYLINDFKLKEGKNLGEKLRILEEIWIDNEFEISKKEIIKAINS